METISRKCQILFSRKTKKNNTNLSSAELAHRVVKVIIWLDLQEIVVLLTVEKGIEMKGLFELLCLVITVSIPNKQNATILY